MGFRRKIILFKVLLYLVCMDGHASVSSENIKSALLTVFPETKIEIKTITPPINKADKISINYVNETKKGVALFQGVNSDGIIKKYKVYFSAWKAIPIAKKRIKPGERVKKEDFQIKNVDLAQGMARQYRGLIYGFENDYKNIEARSSILMGQFPLRTSIIKTPEVRRGATIKVKIKSGGLLVHTIARADQVGKLGQDILITTFSTKKKLTARVVGENEVEVKL